MVTPFPGAAHPFGMMQLTKIRRLGWLWWLSLFGQYFIHTHLSGTGVSDYADILLMPTTGDLHLNNGADGSEGYRSIFSHNKER